MDKLNFRYDEVKLTLKRIWTVLNIGWNEEHCEEHGQSLHRYEIKKIDFDKNMDSLCTVMKGKHLDSGSDCNLK